MKTQSLNHEVLAALAFAGDLSMGQPPEHSPAVACLAEKIATEFGASEAVKRCTVQLSLVRWAGCTANAREFSDLLGDDVRGRAQMIADRNPFVDADPPAGSLHAAIEPLALAHCEATAILSERIGLLPEVAESVMDIFEAWDGSGLPSGKSGEDIAEAAQYVALAGDAEVFSRTYGVPHACVLISSRAGKRYDTSLAQKAAIRLPAWIEELKSIDLLDVSISSVGETNRPELSGESAALILGDFTDIKVPGHEGCCRVAVEIVEKVVPKLGLENAVSKLKIAAAVAGIGRVAVSNTKLSLSSEASLLVPHWTERILSRIPEFGAAIKLAGQAYERLDGRGLGKGLAAQSLSLEARLIQVVRAVVEAPDCIVEGKIKVEAIRSMFASEAYAGGFDERIIEAVLVSLGSKRKRSKFHANEELLTPRETEVLQQLATGVPNKQIARDLGVSPKTVSTHLERIYLKLDVRTRAAATLKALEMGQFSKH
ncbi:HD domain-containing phosphohydrolase [Litoreibacter roseus]|uniref:HTH luxR-type domain-containing protein n=1 Tax=Litoreibacter roseus TaxID=2601869 RepID=A0A6N6JLR8_9RHOB|nr:HD domain-containing phosphohydrolase [Litoreibacter roseus]GFE67025.1 hypothetical protein KIN_40990 [Litoreibacter roseus]